MTGFLPASLSFELHQALKQHINTLAKPYEPLLKRLAQEGAHPIFVGGVVRDFFLSHPTQDLDLEVHAITQEKLEMILREIGGFQFIGKTFGVYSCQTLEISLPRLEKKQGERHQDFAIQIMPDLSFKQAARRRDLTINALGFDWRTGAFLDPYQGLEDLRNNLLRAVDIKTFPDDHLRALRVAVLSAKFGLIADRELLSLCQNSRLQHLSPERIGSELKKLLFDSSQPQLGLEFLKKAGLFQQTCLVHVADGLIEKINSLHKQDFPVLPLSTLTLVFFYAVTPEVVFRELSVYGFSKKLCWIAQKIAENLKTMMAEKRLVAKSDICEILYQLRCKDQTSLLALSQVLACFAAPKMQRLKELITQAIEDKTFVPVVTAADLIEKGVSEGPKLGRALRQCRQIQYESITMIKQQIIDQALAIVN